MDPYKLGKVYVGPKEWFVFYWYWSEKQGKYIREKLRLQQKFLNEKQKLKLLEALCNELNKELISLNKQMCYRSEDVRLNLSKSAEILSLLESAQGDPAVEKNTCATFHQIHFKLEQFFTKSPSFSQSTIYDLDETFLEVYVAFLKADGRASKTINKHLWGLETLTKWAKKQGLSEGVVATKEYRVDVIKNETHRYPPLTHQEKQAAFMFFGHFNPGYQLMLFCQYYTCIRPAELHRLPVKNFDMNRRTIFVPWLSSKNGLSAYVQMLDPLWTVLHDYGIEELNPEWYLFGRRCQPDAKPYQGQYCTNTWGRQRESMGMPIEKQPYGLKHTFNVDYVEGNKHNIDWEFLRRHNRHATIQQTQQYISGLTAYFLDESDAHIIDYSGKKKRGT